MLYMIMRINMNQVVLKVFENFIRFIEALQKKEKDLDEAPMQQNQTLYKWWRIHASKGLEFPVVS